MAFRGASPGGAGCISSVALPTPGASTMHGGSSESGKTASSSSQRPGCSSFCPMISSLMSGASSVNTTEYVELHSHSNFSLLDGASHPEELVKRAAELGMPALALTDHDALYGAVRFAEAAKQHGVQPIFGAEFTLDDNTHLTLLVENEQGWRSLSTLITIARHNAPKGQAVLQLQVLPDYPDGLIALPGCD